MDFLSQVNIKGMVCKRCIDTINSTLSTAGFNIRSISLGKTRMQENYALTDKQLQEGYALLCAGFADSDKVVLSSNN